VIGRTTAAESTGGAVRDSVEDEVAPWHRGFALLAVISVLIGTRELWTESVTISPLLVLTLSACYAGILALAALALVVRTPTAMVRVDIGILVLAAVHVLCGLVVHHRPGDEGALTAQAATSLLAGQHVYGVPWPQVFTEAGAGLTKTMDGGGDFTYGYPPLDALLTAGASRLLPMLSANEISTVVPTVALLLGAVAMFVVLPVPWRSAGTAATLGYPLLPGYAQLGYPAILAVALLVPVVAAWTTIGAGGRLSRGDVARAVCLGAACAAQQLAWFLAPFLLVGLFAVRRGAHGLRPALGVVGGFGGIALATFLVINAPLIARDGGAWLPGILTPLAQHGVPHGQGLIDISYYLTNGSGRLDFYSYATVAYAIGLLVLSVLFVRRLGPALTVLPWTIFFLSIRSQDGYYLLMTPLWLAAAATVGPAAFAGAWQPQLPEFLGRARARASIVGLVGAVLLAPAAICLTIAITSPPPLQMGIVAADAHGPGHEGLWRLTVRIVNTSATSLAPHFAISENQSMSSYWRQTAGPATLAPKQAATVTIVARNRTGYNPGVNGFFELRAVSDKPQTLSTIPIAGPG
jgi:hypothetical protein